MMFLQWKKWINGWFLRSYISFIHRWILTLFFGMGSNLSLVHVVKTLTRSKVYWGQGKDVSAKGWVLDYFSLVFFLAVFTIARPLFAQRNFSHGFYLFRCVIEMKVNIFVVGGFFIPINLLVAFLLQSENTKILWCFLSTNMLWSRNPWGLMTQNLSLHDVQYVYYKIVQLRFE